MRTVLRAGSERRKPRSSSMHANTYKVRYTDIAPRSLAFFSAEPERRAESESPSDRSAEPSFPRICSPGPASGAGHRQGPRRHASSSIGAMLYAHISSQLCVRSLLLTGQRKLCISHHAISSHSHRHCPGWLVHSVAVRLVLPRSQRPSFSGPLPQHRQRLSLSITSGQSIFAPGA